MSKSKLILTEWLALALVLGFIASIMIISSRSQVSADKKLAFQITQKKKITIILMGEVEKTGAYECEPGTSLKTVLKEVGLTRQADRKNIPFKKVLFTSQTIQIPEKTRSLREKRVF